MEVRGGGLVADRSCRRLILLVVDRESDEEGKGNYSQLSKDRRRWLRWSGYKASVVEEKNWASGLSSDAEGGEEGGSCQGARVEGVELSDRLSPRSGPARRCNPSTAHIKPLVVDGFVRRWASHQRQSLDGLHTNVHARSKQLLPRLIPRSTLAPYWRHSLPHAEPTPTRFKLPQKSPKFSNPTAPVPNPFLDRSPAFLPVSSRPSSL